METAEDILKGPEYFWCEKQSCRMSKRTCIKRQCNDHTIFDHFNGMSTIIVSLGICKDCEQGKAIAKEMGEKITRKTMQITAREKAFRRRGTRSIWPKNSYEKRARELGFKNEQAMWREFSAKYSQSKIASLVGCSIPTVVSRQRDIFFHSLGHKRKFTDIMKRFGVEEERQLFIKLRERYTYREMAKILGCAVKTVSNRMNEYGLIRK